MDETLTEGIVMIVKRLARTAALLTLLLLGGCASLSESECLHSDWYDIGFRDGRQGVPADQLSKHAEACGEHGVKPDRERYIDGHESGLRHYCTRHNGLAVGESGSAYQNVCHADVEEDFLSGFSLGQAIYRWRSRLAELDAEAARLEEGITSEKTEKKELQALIARRVQLEGERGAARSELYRLEREADAF